MLQNHLNLGFLEEGEELTTKCIYDIISTYLHGLLNMMTSLFLLQRCQYESKCSTVF